MRKAWSLSGSFFGLLLIVIGGGPSAFAAGGGWWSSGAELLKDAHNPWFIQRADDTSEDWVTYCVDMEDASISATREDVERLTALALDTWMTALKNYDSQAFGSIPIQRDLKYGTQHFLKLPCDGKEDIRFQFGHGTLSREQLDYFSNFHPERTIGVAVRTEYNVETMRGRGFVYIASDQGPFRYDNGEDTYERAWRHRALLMMLLLHETGHVFGLSHAGLFGDLMSEGWPQFMVSKFFVDLLKRHNDLDVLPNLAELNFYFSPSIEWERCEVGDDAKKWFELAAGESCISMKCENTHTICTVRARSAELPPGTGRVAGEFTLYMTSGSLEPAILVYLPPEQKLFPKREGPQIASPSVNFSRYQKSGYFVAASGGKKFTAVGLDRSAHIVGEGNSETFDTFAISLDPLAGPNRIKRPL